MQCRLPATHLDYILMEIREASVIGDKRGVVRNTLQHLPATRTKWLIKAVSGMFGFALQ